MLRLNMSYLQGDVYVIVAFSICPLSCVLIKNKEKVHIWRLEECWSLSCQHRKFEFCISFLNTLLITNRLLMVTH